MNYFMDILEKLNIISIAYASPIEETPIQLETISGASSSTFGSFIIFMFTFIVITLVLLFLFTVINKKNKLEQEDNRSVRILDKIRMDHNSNLFVLKIHDEIHVLGKTDSMITPVTSFNDKDAVQQIELSCAKSSEHSFQSVFNDQLSSLNTSTSMYFKNIKSSSSSSKSFKSNSKSKEL